MCLNNLYRRIFGMHKWESVKPVQYFCGKLDFVNEYNLRRFRFLVVLEQCIMMLCLTVLIIWCLTLSINTASLYNLTSGDNTRSLHKIVFCEFASIAMSRL